MNPLIDKIVNCAIDYAQTFPEVQYGLDNLETGNMLAALLVLVGILSLRILGRRRIARNDIEAAERNKRIAAEIEIHLVIKSSVPAGQVKDVHEYNKVYETPVLDGFVVALAECRRVKKVWLTKPHWTDQRVAG